MVGVRSNKMGILLILLYNIFSTNTYELLFSYKMEPDAGEEPSPVRAIHFLPELRRSCVAMHHGRMFLCNCDIIPTSQVGGEGTFLVTELGR